MTPAASPIRRLLPYLLVVFGVSAFPVSLLMGAAYLGSSLGSYYTPIAPWHETLRAWWPAAFTFGAEETPWFVYGRLLTPAMVLLPLALVGSHRPYAAALGRSGPAAYRTLVVLLGAVGLSFVVGFYTPWIDQSYLLFFPAMLLCVPVAVWYGVVVRRAPAGARALGTAWVVAGLLVLPLAFGIGHNPIGFLGFFALEVHAGMMGVRALRAAPRPPLAAGSVAP